MWLLAASILALAVGPALVRGPAGQPGLLATVDGFVLVTLLGLVLVHIMPDSVMAGGALGGAAAMAGLIVPATLERRLDDRGQVSAVLLWSAIAGLAAHALLDGAALAAVQLHQPAAHERLLAWGVLLHRVPFGITLWWLMRPRLGARTSYRLMGLIAAATVAGYLLAGVLLGALPARALAVLQALVAGSLLHVVVGHQPARLHTATIEHRGHAALGAALALVVLIALSATHHPGAAVAGAASAGHALIGLGRLLAPPVLLTIALTAAVCGLGRAMPSAALSGGTAIGRLRRALYFGVPLPLASCDVLPLHRRLVAAGVPALPAVAVLLAAPQLGLDALVVSYPLLGGALALGRWLAAGLMVVVVAPAVASLARQVVGARPVIAPAGLAARTRSQRLRSGLRFALGDYLDHLAPWLIAGLALGALVEPLLDPAALLALPAPALIGCSAVLGGLLFLPMVGALPVAVVLLHKGISAGAVMAMLLVGPALSPGGVLSVARHHGIRAAVALTVGAVGTAIAAGFATDAWLPTPWRVPLYQVAALGADPVRDALLAVLALLVAVSVLRQGPRAAVAKVVSPRHHRDQHATHGREL